MNGVFEKYVDDLARIAEVKRSGRVRRVVGLITECEGLAAPVGALCEIRPSLGNPVRAEVVGFRDDVTMLMPIDETAGVQCGDEIVMTAPFQRLSVGSELLGRLLDSDGAPLDGRPAPRMEKSVPLFATTPSPMDRPRISQPLATGVRVIDSLHTLGRGQRIGLFSGSGVGKSVLLGMIARYTSADVTVVSLVGERGREVGEFIERDLGPGGLKRSVVIAETSERPAVRRVRAAFAATAIAEYFRDQGLNVLLLMDSLTRVAQAQREIGLSAGEPAAARGFPPSVFATLPRLVERAGQSKSGSITGVYTVLVEGDDPNEPVADSARSVLDGHLWLSRSMAQAGRFPAVDPLQSVSRLMNDVASADHRRAATRIRSILSTWHDAEDLVNVGAYTAGSNPEIDLALRELPRVREFLRQDMNESAKFDDTVARLLGLV